MDHSDQTPNPEKGHPKQDDIALTEEQREHLARRRFLKKAVATTGAATAVGAVASVGGGKAFARSLLYSLSPQGGGGIPSTPTPGNGGGGGPTPTNTPNAPTPTDTPNAPTPTNTPVTPSGKTCTLDTQAPFTPKSSFQLNESVFLSFTVHNLAPGTYVLDLTSDTGDAEFTATSKPFMLQSASNAASVSQFAAGTASDCATQQGTTQGNTVAAVGTVTVHSSSDADVQLVVHIQGNGESAGTYSFTGTCKQNGNTIFTSSASATFGS